MGDPQTLDYTFDERVAQQYEAQRAHPAAVSRAIGHAIAAIVGPDATLIELGVGTGRIARPVAEAGCQLWGIDRSRQMLETTRQVSTGANLHLCQADMHHLPFPGAAFDAALAVHVLHLADDVRAVLAETARVLRSEAWFILGRDWIDPDSVAGKFQMQLRRTVLELSPDTAPPAAGSDVPRMLATLGFAAADQATAAEWTIHQSAADVLRSIATRTHAESWILTDALLPRVVERLTDWAQQEWPDLDEALPIGRRFALTIFRRHP